MLYFVFCKYYAETGKKLFPTEQAKGRHICLNMGIEASSENVLL